MTMKWIRQPHAGKPWGKRGYVELDNGTRVNVEKDDDSISPILARDDSVIIWNKIRTLTLENGDEVYGCADCFYTAPKVQSVFPHRNAHVTPEQRAAKRAAKAAKMAPAAALTPVKRQPASSTPVERRRAVPPAPVATPVPVEDGAVSTVTGLSDAMDAVRVLLARAGSVETLERQLAEASLRASAAEAGLRTVEAELAEYRQLAKKLLGS